MQIKRIEISNFRNFCFIEIGLGARINLILGQNGQGKTNLLESVYLLTTGTSFRYGDVESYINFTQPDPRLLIRGTLERQGLVSDVRYSLTNRTRTIEINGKKSTTTKLTELFSTVLFSPESLMSIKGPPEQRRELLDEMVISINQGSRTLFTQFRRALRSRNRILSAIAQGEMSRNLGVPVLESLNPTYFDLAVKITMSRLSLLRKIMPLAAEIFSSITRNATPLSLEYVASGNSFLKKELTDIYDAMHKRKIELFESELSAGTTIIGPQKHDIQFRYGGKDSRIYCSQGQQRAIILSLKIAQIRYHYELYKFFPILLLDDVMSELDPEVRKGLITFLNETDAQTLITTTDVNLHEELSGKGLVLYSMFNGKIDPGSAKI